MIFSITRGDVNGIDCSDCTILWDEHILTVDCHSCGTITHHALDTRMECCCHGCGLTRVIQLQHPDRLAGRGRAFLDRLARATRVTASFVGQAVGPDLSHLAYHGPDFPPTEEELDRWHDDGGAHLGDEDDD